jgi:hypothetical protein
MFITKLIENCNICNKSLPSVWVKVNRSLKSYDFKAIINKIKEEVKGRKESQKREPGEREFGSLEAKQGHTSPPF